MGEGLLLRSWCFSWIIPNGQLFYLPFWFGSWLFGVESMYYFTIWESWAKFQVSSTCLPYRDILCLHTRSSTLSLVFSLFLIFLLSGHLNETKSDALQQFLWQWTPFILHSDIFFSICVLDLSPLLSLVHLLEMQRAYNRLTFYFKVTV